MLTFSASSVLANENTVPANISVVGTQRLRNVLAHPCEIVAESAKTNDSTKQDKTSLADFADEYQFGICKAREFAHADDIFRSEGIYYAAAPVVASRIKQERLGERHAQT